MNYRRSFLSYAWLFLAPIFSVISWVFLNFSGVLSPGPLNVPYPIFVMVGTTLWTLFLGTYNATADTLKSASGLIFQVKFPHEILVINQILLVFANFLIGFFVTFIVALLYGVQPSWGIVFLPLTFLPIIFFGAGIGLIVCLFSSVVPDLRRVVDLSLNLLFFVTPILYAKNISHPLIDYLISINPLTILIGMCKDLVFNNETIGFQAYALTFVLLTAFFLLAVKFFKTFEVKIIEKII